MLAGLAPRYSNAQIEKAPTTDKIHLQAYFEFEKPKRRPKDRGHWVAVTRDNGASAYCLKEETRVDGPWEYGTKGKPEGAPSGNKNASVAARIREGVSVLDLIENEELSYLHCKAAMFY